MMNLCITLRKDVEDQEAGKQLYEWVKEKLAEHPEVKITGHVTNHFDLDEE